MPIQKPTRRTRRQPKRKEMLVITAQNRAEVSARLRNAADNAQYLGSPYHRVRGSKIGSVTDRQWPDASKCPPNWTRESATRTLRRAIRDGQVSVAWQGAFPRMAWILVDEILYEARLSNNAAGEYHAYPLEDKREWPKELRQLLPPNLA